MAHRSPLSHLRWGRVLIALAVLAALAGGRDYLVEAAIVGLLLVAAAAAVLMVVGWCAERTWRRAQDVDAQHRGRLRVAPAGRPR